ncbi:MAG: succinate dehydrogenase flavoprotein subunit [Deltaproteobacteria bacterium]|nr:succinate dehydrogenase flavoprotein subunit [Deltaproteobacteria bacterium]
MAKDFEVIVVGGGLAGLAACMKLAELGASVKVFSIVPVKRSHSVCAQGGINAAVNIKGEGDSIHEHFDDTIYGGDFLANQEPVKEMTAAAPDVVFLFDRMGVPFNRTDEGNLDFRRFGGTKHHRTAFAGATTGQQLLYALDEQVRRREVEGKVQKFEFWEYLSAVIDSDGVCRGIVAVDVRTLETRTFRADAVMLCTGGVGQIFGKSTNSVVNTGSAASSAYQQGAVFANGEFIQVHPTAIPGLDKLRLMSESARGEGGRVWTYKDGKPWYFLEEKYPAYGNLVPRDIATREIFDVCVRQKLGVNGENMVFLDLTHLSEDFLNKRLGGILEIYETFVGDDPRRVPMKIFPGMHYSMGGLWVDYNLMTNVPGLFAGGECNYEYHGANRLGANALLSCTFDGLKGAPKILEYCKGLKRRGADVPDAVYSSEHRRMQEKLDSISRMDGKENVFKLHQLLGETMTNNVTVVRNNGELKSTIEVIKELKARAGNIGLNGKNKVYNQELLFINHFRSMLELAELITLGALQRDESRGAHYKPDFPERNDEKFLKTTMGKWTARGPEITYAPVDTRFIKPRLRVYNVEKNVTAKATPVAGQATA